MMLWNASRLVGYAIEATDGTIGGIADFFFDDTRWTTRWVVVDTGTWLPGRQVLLSPLWVECVDAATEKLVVGITRRQVEESPDVRTDQPVSRQMEERIYAHYQLPPYWYVPMGDASTPMPLREPAAREAAGAKPGGEPGDGDPHLRSLNEVNQYYIHATDGDIGHVDDFLLDECDWSIRYMVVATRNWWPGKKVLIAPSWTSEISWSAREVRLDLTRAAIRNSPEYDATATVDRDYEERLHRHYDRAMYWI
jgi:hypothetical protein